MSDADSAIWLIRDYDVQHHTVVIEALLLLLMGMTFLLLRRIVRRAYSRSYKLPPQEVDLDKIWSKPVRKVYARSSGNHQASRGKHQQQMLKQQ